jgi:hypothetical protein
MSERETPLTDKASFHRDNGFAQLCEIVVPADFARDLERKLAQARTALEDIGTLAPFSDNSIELRKAREALASIDGVDRLSASNTTSGIQG